MDPWTGWLASERPVVLTEDLLFRQHDETFDKLSFLAQHISTAITRLDPPPSQVFGISAPWGSGKTSALRMIIDLIQIELTKKITIERIGNTLVHNGEAVLTSSTFLANLHQSTNQPPRQRLAYEILRGFPPDYRQTLLDDLDYSDQLPGNARNIRAQAFLVEKIAELASVGPSFEEWILNAFLDYSNDLALHEERQTSHVHLHFVDDLDRCSQAYTAEVLAALNFWSPLPGMFFLIAADEQHLVDSARKATEHAEHYPGEALEKYVHFQVRLPSLIRDYVTAANYCLRLMPAVEGSAGVQHFRSLLENAPHDGSLGVLAPALAARTPRQAKRVLNELLQEFSILRDFKGDSTKRIIARFVWPEAYERYIAPALSAGSPTSTNAYIAPSSSWLVLTISVAAQILQESGHDLNTASERLRTEAPKLGIDLQSCPAEMFLYLAADPPIQAPSADDYSIASAPRTLASSNAILTDSAANQDASDDITDLANQIKVDHALGNAPETIAAARTLADLVDKSVPSARLAPTIGNAAIRLEKVDPATSWRLHEAAQRWDDQHANIRVNVVDFLLDHLEEAWALPFALENLEWLDEHEPDFAVFRRTLCRARIALALGDEPKNVRTLVDQVINGDQVSSFDFWEIIGVVAQSDINFEIDRIMPAWLGANGDNSDVYGLIIRRCANACALMDEPDMEARGLDIYRHLLRYGFWDTDATFIYAVRLVAQILQTRNYVNSAAMLYQIGYDANPEDAQFRASYVGFLVDIGDVTNAQAVQQGQAVKFSELTPDLTEEAFAELPSSFSSASPWWTAYLPTQPIKAVVGI